MTWKGMHCRCRAKTGPAVKDYVEKGITVCDEWKDYLNFLRDMGEQPAGKTIDRIDNTKGYSKENCRWATYKEQVENRVTTVWAVIDGKKDTLKNWCDRIGIASYKLAHRRMRDGWDLEIAIKTPPLRLRKYFRPRK